MLVEVAAEGVRPRVADRQFPCSSEAESDARNRVRELGAAALQKHRKEREHHRAGRATSFAGTPARHFVAKSKAGEEDRKKRSAVVILNL